MRRILLVCATLILLAVCATPAEAGWLRNRIAARQAPGCSTGSCSVGVTVGYSAAGPCVGGQCAAPIATTTVTASVSVGALDQLNAQRAARGLRPYVNDPLLAQAALAAAQFRAARRMDGHVMGGMGDFQFLPPGATARAAGCAAWPAHLGFGACEAYSTSYTYAGAASVTGADGRVYHHLFIR